MIKLKKENIDLIYKLSEWAALFVVMCYIIYRYFLTTSYGTDTLLKYEKLAFIAVVAVGIVRLVLGAWNDIRHTQTKKQVLSVFAKIGLVLLFAVTCLIVVDKLHYGDIGFLPFVMLCLYGVDAKRMMRVFAVCISVLFVITVLSALSGLIPNYLYLGGGRKGILRGSYGICYPTDCASYFVFLLLAAWGSGRFRNWRYTALYTILALFMAYLVHTFIHGVNSTVCLLLISAVILYDSLNERVLVKHKNTRWITKLVDCLTIGAFPLFAASVYVLTWLYGKGNGIAVRINQLISNRLRFTWEAYEEYGLNAFGASTPQNGGGIIFNDKYEFIDSSYGVILIRYGWIFSIIIAALWIFMTVKAVRTGNRRIALAMAVAAFHSIIEQRLTEIHYNILLVLPLCCFAVYNGKNEERKQSKKEGNRIKILTAWCVGAVMTVVFILIAPSLMSYARSLMYWHEEMGNGKKGFVFWLSYIALFALFGYFLYKLIVAALEKKKLSVRAMSGAVTVVIFALIETILINSVISDAVYTYQDKIDSERKTVQLILDNAEEPVYAGQREEFYKRSFNGISNRIFSPEELGRLVRGSILLEHDNDAFQLIGSGARYIELSPYTGLFTYDDALIEALNNEGYRFHGYYSAERNVDFKRLSELNGLQFSETGALELHGSSASIHSGPCMDQISGRYAVTFSLKLISGDISDDNAEVCAVRVSELSDRKLRSEQVIYAKDLDENGHIDVTLNYNVGNTCNVEYPVLCRDGFEINVENISWRNITSVDIWREYSEEGFLIKERYFNGEGEPLIQAEGHYGVEYEYANGSQMWTKCRYLDADGKTPKNISSGYAQIGRQLNDLGRVTEERYFDVNGAPCLCSGNYAGYRQTYNSRGDALVTSYFDTEDKLINNSGGYAIIERDYDDDGNLIFERYLDENNEPIILSGGYAEIHRVYDDEHRVIMESYYGTDGKPVALNNNQAGAAYEYDDDDNIICWRYVDTNGDPVMLTYGYAELHRSYNGKKWITEESYYDTEGNLLVSSDGYAVLERIYDNVGNIICERYLNADRQPVRSNSGYAEIQRVYDSENRVIHEAYFDTDGSPLALSRNQAAVDYGYDKTGNTVLIRYSDVNGAPVMLTDNYSEVHCVYSETGRLLEESYHDTDGRLSDVYGRYAKFENKYDENNILTLTYFTDAAGEPIQCGSSYFHEYLQSLKNRDITIFISVKDEGTHSLTNVLLNDLKEIGVRADLSDKYYNSFYAVITSEGSTEELSDSETISCSGQIGGVSYTIASAGALVGNTSSIIINDVEYSKNTRGMNFVILDNKTGEVIDSAAFDTYDFEMRVTR